MVVFEPAAVAPDNLLRMRIEGLTPGRVHRIQVYAITASGGTEAESAAFLEQLRAAVAEDAAALGEAFPAPELVPTAEDTQSHRYFERQRAAAALSSCNVQSPPPAG